MTTDFPIFELGFFLSRDSEKRYQTKMRRLANSLAKFCVDNELFLDDYKNIDFPVPDNYEIWYQHLSDDGKALVMSQAVDCWMAAIDAGTPTETVAILERALSKIKKNSK